MIQSKLAVCGESVVRDAQTNVMSVFNIIEEVSASAFPVTLPKISALFILDREAVDPEQVSCILTLSTGEHEIGQATIEGDFEGKLRTRVILIAEGVTVQEPGILTVALSVNDMPLDAWSILVQAMEPETTQ